MDGTVFVFVLLYLVLYEKEISGTILNGKLKKMTINFNPKPRFYCFVLHFSFVNGCGRWAYNRNTLISSLEKCMGLTAAVVD